jgi:hypothetical protein
VHISVYWTNGKVKFTLEQAMKAQRGSIHKLYALFYLSTRCGWVVNAKPWPFYLQERDPVPIV